MTSQIERGCYTAGRLNTPVMLLRLFVWKIKKPCNIHNGEMEDVFSICQKEHYKMTVNSFSHYNSWCLVGNIYNTFPVSRIDWGHFQ